MRQRLIAALAAVAIGIVGAVVFASPSNASTGTKLCDFPSQPEVTAIQAATTEGAAEDKIDPVLPRFQGCLEIKYTDKCDGTTDVTMTNWAVIDAVWTRLTVKLLSTEYVIKGGPDRVANAITVNVTPPDNVEIQPWLVFMKPDGDWRIEKKFVSKDTPWTWEEPEACPSPSPSASPSPSPSVSVSTSAPKTTTAAPAPASNDLPVTGISATWMAVGVVLLLLVAGGAEFLRRRRNREPVA